MRRLCRRRPPRPRLDALVPCPFLRAGAHCGIEWPSLSRPRPAAGGVRARRAMAPRAATRWSPMMPRRPPLYRRYGGPRSISRSGCATRRRRRRRTACYAAAICGSVARGWRNLTRRPLHWHLEISYRGSGMGSITVPHGARDRLLQGFVVASRRPIDLAPRSVAPNARARAGQSWGRSDPILRSGRRARTRRVVALAFGIT